MKTTRLFTLSVAALVLALVMVSEALAVKTCYDCHEKQKELYISRKFIHEPTKKEECESCHKRHGFAQTLVLTTTTNDLCYSCHEDLKAEYEKANVHFPVSDGKCWDCHDPHASDKQGLLRAAPEEVDDPRACLMCHKAELEESLHAEVEHPPFNDLNCTVCHAPHASKHGSLLVESANDLCGSCHEASGDKMKAAHESRHIAGLSCTDCHSGHGGEEKGLLSDQTHEPFASGECETCHSIPDEQGKITFEEGVSPNDMCVACHSDIAERVDLDHPHPAMMGDNCTDCHQPHSSRFGKLLVSSQSDLCAQCHDEVLSPKGLTPHLPVVLGQCSECHEVHGSENASLLARSGMDLCLECHKAHGGERAFGLLWDPASDINAEGCDQCHAKTAS